MHQKYMKYLLLDKIIPSNSTMVGEDFENLALETPKTLSILLKS